MKSVQEGSRGLGVFVRRPSPCVYIYIHTHICIYIYMYMYTYLCLYVLVHIYIYTYVYLCGRCPLGRASKTHTHEATFPPLGLLPVVLHQDSAALQRDLQGCTGLSLNGSNPGQWLVVPPRGLPRADGQSPRSTLHTSPPTSAPQETAR